MEMPIRAILMARRRRYYMGIIDILQRWTWQKRVEQTLKNIVFGVDVRVCLRLRSDACTTPRAACACCVCALKAAGSCG